VEPLLRPLISNSKMRQDGLEDWMAGLPLVAELKQLCDEASSHRVCELSTGGLR